MVRQANVGIRRAEEVQNQEPKQSQSQAGGDIGRAEKVPKQQAESCHEPESEMGYEVQVWSRQAGKYRIRPQMVEADDHSAILWSLEPV